MAATNLAARTLERSIPSKSVATGSTEPKWDESHQMKALVWNGTKSVELVDHARPKLTQDTDVIIKVTATTICGSDLHLYSGDLPDMKKGDILGHEFMGIVDECGSNVKNVRKGDRVVVSFHISCGKCEYCKREQYTACSATNSSGLMQRMFGHRVAGIFGYGHLLGGYPGGQAEYVRVPFADICCLKLPDNVSDEKALLLSDVACTGYHATELGEVGEGDVVAIWGLGPIGLMAAKWCQVKKAKKIIGIDCVPERLALARDYLKIDTINFKQEDTCKKLFEIVPEGADVSIDAAGFRYASSLLHKAERAVGLETDTADIINECIYCTRKFGRISLIADYAGYANHVNLGGMMEKGLQVKGSQTPVQKYWKKLLEYVKNGEVDPSFIITHRLQLSDAPEAYEKFFKQQDGVIKVFMRP